MVTTNSFGVLGTQDGRIVGSRKKGARASCSPLFDKRALMEEPHSTRVDSLSPQLLLAGEGDSEIY